MGTAHIPAKFDQGSKRGGSLPVQGRREYSLQAHSIFVLFVYLDSCMPSCGEMEKVSVKIDLVRDIVKAPIALGCVLPIRFLGATEYLERKVCLSVRPSLHFIKGGRTFWCYRATNGEQWPLLDLIFHQF